MRATTDLQPCSKDRLPVGGTNRSIVFNVRADQLHAPSDMISRSGRGNLRASLNYDVAVASVGRGRCRRRKSRRPTTIHTRRNRQGGEKKLIIRIVEQPASDQVVIDR